MFIKNFRNIFFFIVDNKTFIHVESCITFLNFGYKKDFFYEFNYKIIFKI